MSSLDFDDAQIAELRDSRFNELVQAEASRIFGSQYDASQYCWDASPPDGDEDVCRECNEWRRYPPGQRHFGFRWVRTCKSYCECACHEKEIWIC